GIRDLIVTGVQTCALPISDEAQNEPGYARLMTAHQHPDRRLVSFRNLVEQDFVRRSAFVRGSDRIGGHKLGRNRFGPAGAASLRSEEHTSELQSRSDLVCR